MNASENGAAETLGGLRKVGAAWLVALASELLTTHL